MLFHRGRGNLALQLFQERGEVDGLYVGELGNTPPLTPGREAPCIPKLEVFLDEYIAADVDGPLFRTTGRTTGTPHRMAQQDAYRMIQRRAGQAGSKRSAITPYG